MSIELEVTNEENVYRFKDKNIVWDFLEKNSPLHQEQNKNKLDKVILYNYIGKTCSEKDILKKEFTYWHKDGSYYVDILNSLEPEYFIKTKSLEDLSEIEELYLQKEDTKLIGEDKIVNVHNEAIEKAMKYEMFDPDLDDENFTDFFVGFITSIKDYEKSMLSESCVLPMPVRLATAPYANQETTPKYSVFKTFLSGSILEFHFFDKAINSNNKFPVFCRALYKQEKMLIDLKYFIDKNKALSLEEYIEEHKKMGSHKHSLAVLEWFAEHLLEDYIDNNNIKIEDNQIIF
mgnify:CR=1 FL=1|uniref:Uncharacterized protein n=1 Tax=viral metagenome TaxID=1070528 RepID=A0A6C0AC50_9ZZZZ